MQSSEVAGNSEALGKIQRSQNVISPDVSEKNSEQGFEEQLSFDLNSCKHLETGNITAPSHEEAKQKDFTYALKSLVEAIGRDVDVRRELIVSLNPSRKQNIAHELGNIMAELNDFKPIKPLLPDNLNDVLFADTHSLEGKGLQVFSSRVTYFMLVRLVLIHYWRCKGLIEVSDKNLYAEPNLTINQILNRTSSNLITEKHNWLFAKQNNYSWYKMSDETLTEVTQTLSYWEFREESISVLSLLYEEYLDKNGLHKFAHYTPPLMVKFIWDFLKDHENSSSLYRVLGKNRIPKLIFDPTMGSGNFLLEAGRRFKDELDQSENSVTKRLKETTLAYTTGLYGCDIDVFAHSFSEIKLLWLMTTLFKESDDLKLLPHQRVSPSLSIIHQNALKLYNKKQLEMVEPEEEPELSADTSFGLLPLEGHLRTVHSKIRVLEKFDFCIGCPPEQILNEQKGFMKELIEKIPYWKKHYQTNLLYSAWFFVLGLSKLREGGKLIYLTETYWPSEDGASKLRKYILNESKVLCIIDLGKIKIEEDTTLLPQYITLLEKCSSKEERDNHKIKIIKALPQEDPATAAFILGKILAKANVVDRPGKIYSDDEVEIFYSGVQQGELGEEPWQQIYDTGFSGILKQVLSFKTTLTYFCHIDENKIPEEGKTALITTELGSKNHFTIFKEKPDVGNFFTLTPKPIAKESPYYVMALLNSPVLNFWYANNGNKKDGRHVYEPSSLKMIPIRPIDFGKPMEESLKKEKMAQIESAIQKFDEKYLMANLNLELTHGREEIVHDAIAMIQNECLNLEKNLKRYDSFFIDKISDLTSANSCPVYNPFAFRDIYPPDKQCALKEHEKVFVHKENVENEEAYCMAHFKRQVGIKNEGDHVILISKDNRVIKIYAPNELLDFIEKDLHKLKNHYWNEIEVALLLPRNVEEFSGFKEDIVSHCLALKNKQINITKIMHQLIYKLYGFNIDDKDSEKAKAAQNAIQVMDATS